MLDPAAPLAFVQVALAGAGGGALNAVAGGGSFILFPAMLLAGLGAREANASTTVGLLAALVASFGGYRAHARGNARVGVPMGLVSLAGGLAGALLLLRTPTATFQRVLPLLLLAATALFAAGPVVTRRLSGAGAREPGSLAIALGCAAQLVIATYGGYFGGGMGILMLATMSLMGMREIPRMNALKVTLAFAANAVAAAVFVSTGLVHFGLAAAAALGGVVGGFAGARVGTRANATALRVFVVVVGLSLSVRFFLR
jgi:hypothetical protein